MINRPKPRLLQALEMSRYTETSNGKRSKTQPILCITAKDAARVWASNISYFYEMRDIDFGRPLREGVIPGAEGYTGGLNAVYPRFDKMYRRSLKIFQKILP